MGNSSSNRNDQFAMYVSKLNRKFFNKLYRHDEHIMIVPNLKQLCSVMLQDHEVFDQLLMDVETKCAMMCRKHDRCIRCCYREDVLTVERRTKSGLYCAIRYYNENNGKVDETVKCIEYKKKIEMVGEPGIGAWEVLIEDVSK